MRTVRVWLCFLLLALASQLPYVASAAPTCWWMGPGSDWFDAANWDDDPVDGCTGRPTAADEVRIPAPGTGDDARVIIDRLGAFSAALFLGHGTVTIQDGGVLTSSAAAHDIAHASLMHITGPGAWNVEVTDAAEGVRVGRLNQDLSEMATLILDRGGKINVTGLGSRIVLGVPHGTGRATRAQLVIGGQSGEAPAAPGFVNVDEIEMGRDYDGDEWLTTGLIVFNHTDETGNYTFAPNIIGAGRIQHENGVTVLTGDNSYIGETVVEGGTLRAGGANAFVQNGDYIVNGGRLDLGLHDLTMSSLSGTGGEVYIGALTPGNNVTLTIDQANDTTFAGNIHAEGHFFSGKDAWFTLVKDGAGTLTLTGENVLNDRTNGGLQVLGGTVAIADGGSLRGHWGRIRGDDNPATVRVTGEGSLWTVSGQLIVGDADGSGTLIIDDGGKVTSTQLAAAIGLHARSSGRVMLKNGASWDHRANLYIGYDGTGRLEIDTGSDVTSATTHIGLAAGAHGEVIVVNASTWTTSDNMFIGDSGSGMLSIGSGAQVTVGTGGPRRAALIGFWETGVGDVSVTDSGSSWAVGQLQIGHEGSGTLMIADGATGESYETTLGSHLTGVGVGVVRGQGSRWSTRGVTVGDSGTGALTVADGGTLDTSFYDITLAHGADARGTLRIGDGGAAGHIEGRAIVFGAGEGVLVFDHTDDDYEFRMGLESVQPGHGRIDHVAGTTRLIGGGLDFSGETIVHGGRLFVDYATLGGTLTVKDGATVGGHGRVGSTVVEDGGILAPGDATSGSGTLVVDGDLTLSSGSILAFTLGRPGFKDDPSDGTSGRIRVTGDLALDGTLNLSQSDRPGQDGTVGLGYYRLMTYDGALTDNGLQMGIVPDVDGGAPVLLTGDNRVDLFFAALGDDTLQHWRGGDGVWDADEARWLNKDGEAPVAWAGNIAVFKHEPGGFTGGIIDVKGTQRFQGLQFVDRRYSLVGSGALATHDGGSEIRVLADLAEISTVITGTGGIVITGGGTLMLAGHNSYEGGTTIRDGTTVEVSTDANLGAVSGGLTLDGGTLRAHLSGDLTTDRNVTLGSLGGTVEVIRGGPLARGIELDGKVTGVGGLRKTGSGELVLSNGDNDYSGGTIVSEGALDVIASGALGTGDVLVDGADSLLYFNGAGVTAGDRRVSAVDGGDIRLLNGADGGTAQFSVDEDSRMLVNVNSGGGAATIGNRGLLRFYDGATADKARITNAGDLLFETGAGAGEAHIVNLEDGIVQFRDDAYAHDTTIVNADGGTVDISGVSEQLSIGSLSGGGEVIVGGKTLMLGALGRDDMFDGAFVDDGLGDSKLVKVGTGTLFLGGDHEFTGTIEVNDGRLQLNSSLASSAQMFVGAGATLGGSGTIGTTIVRSGGTLAPGNSIGTLTVDGDLTLETGTTFAVEVNPDGSESDLVQVTGRAIINGGSVAHIGANGHYKPLSAYRILSAGTGLTGAFEQVTSDFAFLTPELLYDYDAFTIDLQLTRNDIDFADKAATRNQRATAIGVDSIGFGNEVLDAILSLPDDDDVIHRALDLLSGEVHASLTSGLLADGRFVQEAMNGRLRGARTGGSPDKRGQDGADGIGAASATGSDARASHSGGFGDWGQASANRESFDGDGNAAAIASGGQGFLVGADDYVVGDWRLGLLFGYSRASIDIPDRISSATSGNYHLGFYAGSERRGLSVRSGLAGSWHDISTNRSVAVGDLSNDLTARYDGRTVQAFGELGYVMETGLLSFEPFANVTYANVRTDGFTEQGGAAPLSVENSSTDMTAATVGVRMASAIAFGNVDVTARGTVGWSHAFADTTPISSHAFADGEPFTIAGVPAAIDGAHAEVGLDVKLTSTATLGVSYVGRFAAAIGGHSVNVKLGLKF